MASGLLHWYAAFTLSSNTLGVEGGDQLTVNLGALLCFASLVDRRIWGWSASKDADRSVANIWVNVALFAARLQVAFVYFEAAIVKLTNPLWSDGTAMWLWVQNAGFGASPTVTSMLQTLFAYPWIAAATTWGTIALELFLCFAVAFAPATARLTRDVALVTGLVFHLLIALTMGLISFGIVMTAALLLAIWRAADGTRLFRAHPRGELTTTKPGYEPSGSRSTERMSI